MSSDPRYLPVPRGWFAIWFANSLHPPKWTNSTRGTVSASDPQQTLPSLTPRPRYDHYRLAHAHLAPHIVGKQGFVSDRCARPSAVFVAISIFTTRVGMPAIQRSV